MAGIPGTPPDMRHVPQGCAFHLRCQFAFDACRKQVPILSAPGVAGVHIGEQRLELGNKQEDTIQSKRSQQCQVACHLYNTELVDTHIEDVLQITAYETQASRVNGVGDVGYMETGGGHCNE
jgi:hypothetical protein